MDKPFTAKIEYRSPEDLTPYFRNPKQHDAAQIDKIAGSIAEFDFDQPIVVDEAGTIIKGHGRRDAAIRLGLKKVPVIVRSDLSPAKVKAARISDNKVAEAPWINDALHLEFEELKELDIDLKLTGFDSSQLLTTDASHPVGACPSISLFGRSPSTQVGAQ